MYTFRISPKFFIFFTLIVLIPTTIVSKFLQDLLQQFSSINIVKQLIGWGLIEPPTTVLIIIFLFWLYDAHLWKFWPFCYIHSVPNINGRYEGEGESSFNKKYKMILEIKQTLSNINISSYFEKSLSSSTIANIVKNEHNNWSLSYIYRNNPITVNTDLDMRMHEGFASIEIFDGGKKLKGKYFNDSRERRTHGVFSCKLVGRKKVGYFNLIKLW